MKQFSTFVAFLILAVFLHSVSAQVRVHRLHKSSRLDENGLPKDVRPGSRERISAEELEKKREANGDLFGGKLKSREIPESLRLVKTIYDDSIVLQIEDNHTVIPKGSVIYFPDRLEKLAKIGEKNKGEFMSWPAFEKKYHGYLAKFDVSLPQINGEENFSENEAKAFYAQGKIIVAAYRDGLITCKANLPEITEK